MTLVKAARPRDDRAGPRERRARRRSGSALPSGRAAGAGRAARTALAGIAAGLALGPATGPSAAASTAGPDTAQAVVEDTCRRCHNDRARYGGLSLDGFDVARAGADPRLAEKIIRKVRTGLMPPAGAARPDEAALQALAETLETLVARTAAERPLLGRRGFQRLNRAEYERSIRDLLALDVRASDYLPPDTKSAGFDNVADAQLLSPTLMNGYLRAAAEISRLAVGDPAAAPREATYRVTRWASQREQVEGAPYGSRGGLSVVHTFPADAEYRFRVSFHHETTGELFGSGRGALHTAEHPERVEVSIDGERVALLDVDRWMHVSDPDGVNLRTEPVRVTAGPHRVSAVFVRHLEGPAQDLISPHEWSLSSTSVADAYGVTSLPHLRDLAIRGPLDPVGVSDTPSRRRIFTCRPAAPRDAPACAREILGRLGTAAWRRPLTDDDLRPLMGLYVGGAAEGGFEAGVRMALEGVLASPRFVFRFEAPPAGADPADGFAVSDHALASRLSFFLWSAGPDAELVGLAAAGRLSDPAVLDAQVRRMLADPRSEALATRFAAQWLRLPDLDAMHPDVRTYPDFDEQLKRAMRRETELFFHHLVREDRSLVELLTADYSFVNERLARHYRLPGVAGAHHRRVVWPAGRARRGLLGHGSVLTLTSHPDRTSPVLRGKWVMEVLLGSPPPPPPPDVPDLDGTAAADGGRPRSVRERLEHHRRSPACSSCHRMMDPIGLALEHYGVTGARRVNDNGNRIDASGALYDGTPLAGAGDLRAALLDRPGAIARTFAENLMAYALGRRLEYFDMPAVREVARAAEADGLRLSRFILEIVRGPAFRTQGRAPASVENP